MKKTKNPAKTSDKLNHNSSVAQLFQQFDMKQLKTVVSLKENII